MQNLATERAALISALRGPRHALPAALAAQIAARAIARAQARARAA